jgi:hypothetical protein
VGIQLVNSDQGAHGIKKHPSGIRTRIAAADSKAALLSLEPRTIYPVSLTFRERVNWVVNSLPSRPRMAGFIDIARRAVTLSGRPAYMKVASSSQLAGGR